MIYSRRQKERYALCVYLKPGRGLFLCIMIVAADTAGFQLCQPARKQTCIHTASKVVQGRPLDIFH